MEKKVSKAKKVVKVEVPVAEPVKVEVKKEWVNLTIDEIYALNTVVIKVKFSLLVLLRKH